MTATGIHATDLTFIHLTDLHLDTTGAERTDQLPAIRLRRAIDRVRSMEITPAFWLITGDLVNNGLAAEYQLLQPWLAELRSLGIPVIVGLGNHDARLPFRLVVLQETTADEQPYYHSTLVDGVNVIMLDSTVPNEPFGYLDETQLAWLAAELAKPVGVGHLIALHHPPVHSTVALLDTMVLTNSHDLAAVVAGHENVLGILSGHIHYNHVARFANTVSFTAPALFYTIDPGVQKNFRTLDGSGFAIGTVRYGQLFMNTVMLPGGENQLAYRLAAD